MGFRQLRMGLGTYMAPSALHVQTGEAQSRKDSSQMTIARANEDNEV